MSTYPTQVCSVFTMKFIKAQLVVILKDKKQLEEKRI